MIHSQSRFMLCACLCACGNGTPQPGKSAEPAPVDRAEHAEEALAPRSKPPAPPQLRHELSVEAVPAERGDVLALVGGGTIVCGVRKDADTACMRSTGLKGYSDETNFYQPWAMRERPYALEGIRVRAMDAGWFSRCVILENDDLKCWGPVLEGKGTDAPVTPPVGSRALGMSIASEPMCIIDEERAVVCWGGEPCIPPGMEDRAWLGVRKVADGARAVSVGRDRACFVTVEGTVRCWGHADDEHHCIGEGIVEVPGLADVVQIEVGRSAACALVADGQVKCWGSAEDDLLGSPTLPSGEVVEPIAVPGVAPAVKLHGYFQAMCALRSNGEVWCWGSDIHGNEAHLPATRIDKLGPAIDILATEEEACSLLATREVRCFGPERRPRDLAKSPPVYESRDAWVNAPVFHLGTNPSAR